MNNIIVGFDFSTGSANAVDLTIDIANKWKSDIRLVYVKKEGEDETPIREEIERRNAGVARAEPAAAALPSPFFRVTSVAGSGIICPIRAALRRLLTALLRGRVLLRLLAGLVCELQNEGVLLRFLGSLFRLCKKSIIQTYRSLFLRLLEVYFLDLQKYDFHTSGSRYPRPPEAHHQIFRHPNTPDQKNHRYIRLHPVHRQPHSRFPDSFPPASSCVAKFLT